jgi:hypothetical protein
MVRATHLCKPFQASCQEIFLDAKKTTRARAVPLEKPILGFGDCDGAGWADLDAALTAQALILIRHTRLVTSHLKDADGANIDALFVPGAFIGINLNPKSH